LEADATIPAEYILLNHYLGEPNPEIEGKLAVYLRRIQGSHGGWPLFHDGDFNISASVKAYFALKLAGDDPQAAHMAAARQAILHHGGAAKANVFTRIALALFGQVPWRAVPVMRVEAVLLPRWAPFHIEKVSYWSRTVMVPLLILAVLKPTARNPKNIGIEELFVHPANEETDYMVNPTGHIFGAFFLMLDRMAHVVEPFFPKKLEQHAIKRALDFILPRLNDKDGLGAIFPAMVNAVMALDALNYARDDPNYVTARKAIDDLLIFKNGEAYCQPCLSPVWDTALGGHALVESALDSAGVATLKAANWLVRQQILDVPGDWASMKPDVRPGGWAFQYNNAYYPDVDDTAVVGMLLHRVDAKRYKEAISRAEEWIVGMQSRNGGWGAFDADNSYSLLQHIPFADHGALLDPPTADVSARCISFLAQLGRTIDDPVVRHGVEYLRAEQEADGSWFGRWGNNYVYGTWSVLSALNAVGEDMNAPYIRRAVDWVIQRQRYDGGWGEDCASYWQHRRDEVKVSTPSQTSWAVLALIAAGELHSTSVKKGIDFY
jgi:squalene-hopene/tetraprenyl-beta-curcumene cyclase